MTAAAKATRTRGSANIALQIGIRASDLQDWPGCRTKRTAAGRERSAPGYLAPGKSLVGTRFSGESEHPFSEDVLHDVGRPALDRVGLHPQEGLLRVGQIHCATRAFERVTARVEHRVGAHEVHDEAHDALVEARHRELADGPFRPGRSLATRLAGAHVGEAI